MKTPLIEKLTEFRSQSGLSYDKLGEKTGISSSTICRWYKGQGVPSLDEIELLCDAMGFDIKDIFVSIGKQEMTATQDIGYQGAAAMVEHYEARLTAYKEQVLMLQSNYEQSLKKRDETFERSVAYLKTQVDEMRKDRKELQVELDAQRKRADNLDHKRHNVFWGMLAALILLLVLMVVMIAVDAPGIGMGWK